MDNSTWDALAILLIALVRGQTYAFNVIPTLFHVGASSLLGDFRTSDAYSLSSRHQEFEQPMLYNSVLQRPPQHYATGITICLYFSIVCTLLGALLPPAAQLHG